ncbi:sensor histidine kinase KdpD, partial [bacterium]|nr:sensor histidine kinase KdpD [bacterium]
VIALLNGVLTSRVRGQEKKIRVREERTNALYQLTKDLAVISGLGEVTEVASAYILKYFKLDCYIFIKSDTGSLEYQSRNGIDNTLSENDMSIANWVFRNSLKAGKNTDTLPSSDFVFFPLTGDSGTIGVIACKQPGVFTYGEEQFWDACLAQITGKYEREMLREAAKRTYVIGESEKLYKTLFNSLSHELRIPVATILGASDTLIAQEYSEETRKQLYSEINTASLRLNRLIENLLNMSRLESGLITPRLDWYDVHDLANRVADSLQTELKPFKLSVIIPSDMPMVKIDFGLMEQVLHNLVLNATQHSPAGSQIRLKFFIDNEILTIQVMDRGPGFSYTDIQSVFNKFYRGKEAKAGGTGLGLSIVKGFVEALKGNVAVENRRNGGALFTIKIPAGTSDIDILNSTPD